MNDPELMPLDASEDELRGQGQALRKTLESEGPLLRHVATQVLSSGGFERVVLLGSGDSHYSAQAIKYGLELVLGWPCEALEAIEAKYLARPLERTLAFLISSSGASKTTVEALQTLRAGKATTVGVTNTPGSPIWTQSDFQLRVHATRDGFPTQSSTAAMAIIIAFAVKLAQEMGRDSEEIRETEHCLGDLASRIEDAYTTLAPRVRMLASELGNARPILFIGAGPSFGAAAFGLAKLKEASQGQGTLLGLEEFHHIECFALERGQVVVLVAPEGVSITRAHEIVSEVARMGGRLVVITTAGSGLQEPLAEAEAVLEVTPVPEWLSPILTVIPLQILALELARTRVRAGYRRPLARDFKS